MATHQQSIYHAPLVWPHFSSPFIVPHYYGHTSAVQSCPTIMATHPQSSFSPPLLTTHQQSSHGATLLCPCWLHIVIPPVEPQYYGHTPTARLQSPTVVITHQQSSHGAPLLWPHRLSSQATAIMAARYQSGRSPLTHCLTYWYGNSLEYLEVWSWLWTSHAVCSVPLRNYLTCRKLKRHFRL
jgi:hypothetical protein